MEYRSGTGTNIFNTTASRYSIPPPPEPIKRPKKIFGKKPEISNEKPVICTQCMTFMNTTSSDQTILNRAVCENCKTLAHLATREGAHDMVVEYRKHQANLGENMLGCPGCGADDTNLCKCNICRDCGCPYEECECEREEDEGYTE